MLETSQILAPVMVLVGWTLIILIWLYAKRIPVMKAAKIQPNDSLHQDLSKALPLNAQQVAANYNHLMEQPTIFYTAAIAIAVMGHIDQVIVFKILCHSSKICRNRNDYYDRTTNQDLKPNWGLQF